MYDEVMQLIALAKNDEAYFKRIDALKQQMLELAQVKEIAATLNEADMHLASARQKAAVVIQEAELAAKEIEATALALVAENKKTLVKNKEKQDLLVQKETELATMRAELKLKETELEAAILEHRKLTAQRTEEFEKAQKVRVEFEDKLRRLKEIAAH